MPADNLTPEQQFFVDRYDFIYRELNRLQDNIVKIEAETNKMLTELQSLREKEKQTFETDG